MADFGDMAQEGTTVTSTNWFEREIGAVKNMCFGFVLVIVLSIVIFKNESNYVSELATADKIKSTGEFIATCQYSPNNNGKLIVVPCQVTEPNLVPGTPPLIQKMMASFEGTSISWSVEILQWVKKCHTTRNCHKTNTGGEECTSTTTCNDEQEWVSNVNTGELEDPSHSNYGTHMPSNFHDGSVSAQSDQVYMSATKGHPEQGYQLDQELLGQFPSTSLPLKSPTPTVRRYTDGDADGTLQFEHFTSVSDGTYMTGNSIGDIKVSLTGSGASIATVAAKQTAASNQLGGFLDWPAEAYNIFGQKTKPIKRIHFSSQNPTEFGEEMERTAGMVVYAVRIGCFILMVGAFKCIFEPLSTAADLLMFLNYCTCCLGSILDHAAQSVIGAVSCCSACMCFTFLFVISWMFVHPWYIVAGSTIMVCGCGIAGAAHASGAVSQGKVADARSLKLNLVADESQAHFIRCVD